MRHPLEKRVEQPTLVKGNYAELRVLADLVRLGYTVSIPFGGSARYDLIADKDGSLLRIQVKHASLYRDAVLVKCNSSPGGKDNPYRAGEIDVIAAYEPTTDAIYYVPYEIAKGNSRAVSLRLSPSKNNQTKGTRLAASFLTLPASQKLTAPTASATNVGECLP